MLTTEERFWAKVDPCRTDGCALWMGAISPNGYGAIKVNGRTQGVHRLSFELHNGPIPEGLTIDHVLKAGCTHKECVWPAHLEAVSLLENQRRAPNHWLGIAAIQTHCINGHVFDEANTYIHPKRGTRSCKTCNRQRYKNWKLERKGKRSN